MWRYLNGVIQRRGQKLLKNLRLLKWSPLVASDEIFEPAGLIRSVFIKHLHGQKMRTERSPPIALLNFFEGDNVPELHEFTAHAVAF